MSQNFSAPLRKPKAPQCPPTEKILATPLDSSRFGFVSISVLHSIACKQALKIK